MAKKKKKMNYKLINIIIYIIIFLCFTGMGFIYYIYLNAPEFNINLLYKKEASNIYDSKGDLIATIGSEKRRIVSYEELPNVLIDAIIATEDSRFFQHKGMDIPRFLKAGFSFINGKNIGGASTLTMQISKNSFTNNKTNGIKGIIRKFTDIYISIFNIEKKYNKKEIIEFYVNSPYLGGGAYGIQMASQIYFNKNITDLNLVEAAIIAGMFQAPSEYDPFINPEKTNKRKNEVINLMLRHGYINNSEAKFAKEINVNKIISKRNNSINKYQGFIDTVIQEVIDKTGKNPYETSMDIYSTMIKEKQDIINNFYKTHKFKDEKVQVGIGAIDNKTGAIIAVGAGRGKNSEMSLNYATQIKRHPGSTAKPIFDYAPGIEYYNWSTYTPFVDKPVKYTYGGIMKNVDGRYQGFLTLQDCLVKSRNTCALQAFKRINNSKIDSFVNSVGIIPEYLNKNNNYINEAHSIGGFTGVSPIQLASAYASFGSGGYYIEPHSFTKIIYKNKTKENIQNFNYKPKKVMKDTTAYMISYMLKKVTSYSVKVKNTDISTKTGTSSYDDKILKKLGLSKNVIQDAWTVTYSPDYSIAIWYGYDKLSKKTYNTASHAWSERIKIQRKIINKFMEQNSRFKTPNGIVALNVVVGSMEAKLPSISTPKSKIEKHLFIKGTQPTKIDNSYFIYNSNNEKDNKKIIEEKLPNNLLP